MFLVIGIYLESVQESPLLMNRALFLGLGILSFLSSPSLMAPFSFFPYNYSILFSPVGFDRGNLSRLLMQA